jgi:hypothetical protein
MRKLYQGRRYDSGAEVLVISDKGKYPLPRRNDVSNHSPDGFEWGYGGSGPAQLALALCIDALGGNEPPLQTQCAGIDDQGGCVPLCRCAVEGPHAEHRCGNKECGNKWWRSTIQRALRVYQGFKFQHIATLDGPLSTEDEWSFTADQVLQWIAELEKGRPQ